MFAVSVASLRHERWKVAALAFLAISAVHLLAQLFGNAVFSSVTQVLLMSLLALTVLAATQKPRTREVRLLLLALFFSWLGDTLPRFGFENGFLMMVGFFLIAQIVFIWLFWPLRKASIVYRNAWFLLPYLGWFAMLVTVCVPKAGSLLIPIVLYGTALLAMAVLSTSFGPVATLGGALFFFSDSLIAVRSIAGFEFPMHSFLIMLTYIAAQALLSFAIINGNGAVRENR